MVPRNVLLVLLAVPALLHALPVGKPLESEDAENSLESDYFDYSDEAPDTVAPSGLKLKEFEKRLDDYLGWYYDKYVSPEDGGKPEVEDRRPKADSPDDPHDQMQSDQPANIPGFGVGERRQDLGPLTPLYPFYVNLSMVNLTKYSEENHNFSDIEYIRTMRNRRNSEVEDRTKDTWIQMLKDNILRQVGRVNSSMPRTGEEIEISTLNISHFMPNLHIPNDSLVDDEFITEKIRSYYPSCEIPRNTDQEVWKDENTMNLYFNVDHGPEENGVTIATATLRLYRLPQENSSVAGGSDSSCENTSSGEDDKLLRISIYWYTKSLKKHRVKRRLSDSKVIGDNAKWVELSVRPATRAWVRGRNLGLAVLVEDQDGTVLKADKFFKGASCTQPQNLSQPSLSMQQDGQMNWNEVMAILEEIQQQPCITTYHCSQQ